MASDSPSPSPSPLPARTTSRHAHRADLVGEHPFGDLGQLLFILVFIVFWLIDSFWLKWSTWFNGFIPLYIRICLGTLLLVLGGIIARKTMKMVFGEIRDPPRVIQEGIYGFCRHPMYLSALLVYVALFLYSWSLIALGVFLGALLFYSYIARYEEHLLVTHFGDSYRQYQAKVPRWGIKLR